MSTLQVNTINASTSGQAVAVDVQNPRSFRNLIINGNCLIDQRNGGSSVTSGYAIDRTHIEGFQGGGSGTAQQVSDGPSGFTKSLKITVTGTDTSLAASDFYTLRHIIEGQNVSFLGFGASGGTSVTLSFWVKSSVTGTFCAGLGNGSNNRTMPKEYSISSANTWEKKTLTFPADTTGTWGTDNGRGFSIRWCMGAGSTRTATADTYNASEAHCTSNQTNLFATNAATFQITGMQLEAGSYATDFEHRSYGEELQRCSRYCQVMTSNATSERINFADVTVHGAGNGIYIFPGLLPMRAAPSITTSGSFNASVITGGWSTTAVSSITSEFTTANGNDKTTWGFDGMLSASIADSCTVGLSGQIFSSSGFGKFVFSAEL